MHYLQIVIKHALLVPEAVVRHLISHAPNAGRNLDDWTRRKIVNFLRCPVPFPDAIDWQAYRRVAGREKAWPLVHLELRITPEDMEELKVQAESQGLTREEMAVAILWQGCPKNVRTKAAKRIARWFRYLDVCEANLSRRQSKPDVHPEISARIEQRAVALGMTPGHYAVKMEGRNRRAIRNASRPAIAAATM